MKKEALGERLSDLRYSNTRGTVIPLHHAFLTLRMRSFERISAIVMPLFFLAVVWLFLPLIARGWAGIFEFWMQKIYDGHVAYHTTQILGRMIEIPYPMLDAVAPSIEAVHWNLWICIVAFLVSFLMPPRIAPVTYIVRATLLIQSTASIDRLLSPDFFPYTLPLYITDTLSLSVYMVFILPLVLGFIYYIFDFGLWRKVTLTMGMLFYYFLTIPCQYMLHAVIIHEGTLLLLPLMYLMFGTLLDVLMFVSIYAIGMSWHDNNEARNGRGL